MSDAMRLADKLIETRDVLRSLLGPNYEGFMAPFRKAIKERSKETGMPLIHCALDIGQVQGTLGSVMLAAACDLLEGQTNDEEPEGVE